MSNSNVTVSHPFSNVKIPAGKTFTFRVNEPTDGNYYAFGVNGTSVGFLTIKNGWQVAEANAGPICRVTNEGSSETNFNLVLMSVGAATSAEKVTKLD